MRHPAYACYIITYLGYLIENPSTLNVAIYFVVHVFQIVRIAKGEAVLSRDPAYAMYRERVHHRLVPFLY